MPHLEGGDSAIQAISLLAQIGTQNGPIFKKRALLLAKSVIFNPGFLITQSWLDLFFPFGAIPGTDISVNGVIFLRNGMGSDYYI